MSDAADAHYHWGSVFFGYLLYDTAFMLAFYTHLGSLAFLTHHAVGLVCCTIGLYGHKMAIFGMLTQVEGLSTANVISIRRVFACGMSV